MATRIQSSEAQQSFGEVMDRALAGEDVIVERDGSPRVAVIAYDRYQGLTEQEQRQPLGIWLASTPEWNAEEYAREWDELMQLIEDCAVDTGITDLADEHDHYIHGTPKRAASDTDSVR